MIMHTPSNHFIQFKIRISFCAIVLYNKFTPLSSKHHSTINLTNGLHFSNF
ncbi:hypothetical protein [Yellowstone lake mimivirus]|uniref:hypothetical protein n=1 Tax=Yellowstone lake mimivirus TaxID=1586712 RepID=UPI0006EBAF24|nr:hypothetical protein AR680_gp028 [Yellowstone lake mimivirus]BAT21952.1 hypothetical protein [Yellowstone lake mimivirus]